MEQNSNGYFLFATLFHITVLTKKLEKFIKQTFNKKLFLDNVERFSNDTKVEVWKFRVELQDIFFQNFIQKISQNFVRVGFLDALSFCPFCRDGAKS